MATSPPMTVKVGLWNMLSDVLGVGEFLTLGGDDKNVKWGARKHKVVAVLRQMLEQLDVVAVVENDHFHWILHELRRARPSVGALHMLDLKKAGFRGSTVYKHWEKLGASSGHTFGSERAPEAFANLYECGLDDPYRADDGLSLYYNSDSVYPVGARSAEVSCGKVFFKQRFKKVSGGEFTVVLGHLPSGTKKANEEARLAAVSELCAQELETKTVVLMDSNYSSLYPRVLEQNAQEFLQSRGWVNVVPEEGSECFKMRHAQGEQPAKFGEMMFDAIDRIMLKEGEARPLELTLSAFKRSLAQPEERAKMLALRTNPEGRKALKEAACKGRWGDDSSLIPPEDVEGLVELGLLRQLYPNENAPSDHPPVAAVVSWD